MSRKVHGEFLSNKVCNTLKLWRSWTVNFHSLFETNSIKENLDIHAGPVGDFVKWENSEPVSGMKNSTSWRDNFFLLNPFNSAINYTEEQQRSDLL